MLRIYIPILIGSIITGLVIFLIQQNESFASTARALANALAKGALYFVLGLMLVLGAAFGLHLLASNNWLS